MLVLFKKVCGLTLTTELLSSQTYLTKSELGWVPNFNAEIELTRQWECGLS